MREEDSEAGRRKGYSRYLHRPHRAKGPSDKEEGGQLARGRGSMEVRVRDNNKVAREEEEREEEEE